jgi:hypothetical protein
LIFWSRPIPSTAWCRCELRPARRLSGASPTRVCVAVWVRVRDGVCATRGAALGRHARGSCRARARDVPRVPAPPRGARFLAPSQLRHARGDADRRARWHTPTPHLLPARLPLILRGVGQAERTDRSTIPRTRYTQVYLFGAVRGTRKIRNTTLTQVTVLNTFNSTVRAQRD